MYNMANLLHTVKTPDFYPAFEKGCFHPCRYFSAKLGVLTV
jgi:hypothetical protein